MSKINTRKTNQSLWIFFTGMILLMGYFPEAQAQEKHALIIGIDKYVYEESSSSSRLGDGSAQPRKWSNLRGAVNDAKNMKELLVSRFAFDRNNIQTLFDEDATRDNILDAIEEYVVNSPNPGDEVFFYYAGHGSQVPNSLSDEPNKMDETLVPTDAFFGAEDVRDKELRALFNQALDRDIKLTLIFDSCHSGSITRGVPSGITERKMDPATYDVADGSLNNLPSPEERGALVLSSARDEQTAKERFNPQTEMITGIFTDTLVRVILESQPNEPISRIMERVQAIVKSSIADQDPVLAGNEDRVHASLFGGTADMDDALYAAVLQVAGNTIVLQGGRAIGLNEGAVLEHYTASDDPATITVTKLEQLTQAIAQVTSGNAGAIETGDLFRVVSFGISDAPAFTVYIPEAVDQIDDIFSAAQTAYQTAQEQNSRWVTDPTRESETFTSLSYTESGWTREAYGQDSITGNLTEAAMYSVNGTASPVFMNIPPTQEMKANFDFVKDEKSIIRVTNERSQADYILTGIYEPGQNEIHYRWIRPNMTSVEAPTSIFPVSTDPVSVSDENVRVELNKQINAISRIKGWIDLDAPPSSRFPFKLGFRNTETGEMIESGHLDVGNYDVVLVNTMGAHPQKFDIHHVYVFFADNTGRIGLLYPNTSSSSAFPTAEWINRDEGLPETHTLMTIPIEAPLASNAVFMLTSKTPIGNTRVFNQEPVVGERGGTRAPGASPLESLITDRNTATRTFGSPPVVDWSLSRVFVTTGSKK